MISREIEISKWRPETIAATSVAPGRSHPLEWGPNPPQFLRFRVIFVSSILANLKKGSHCVDVAPTFRRWITVKVFLKIDRKCIYSMVYSRAAGALKNREMTPFDPPFEQKSIWEFLSPREQRGSPRLFFRGSAPLFTSGSRSFQYLSISHHELCPYFCPHSCGQKYGQSC